MKYSFNSSLNFKTICDKLLRIFITLLSLSLLLFILWLLYTIVNKGIQHLSWQFLSGIPDDLSSGGGIGPFLFNSLYITILSMLVALPISLGAGVYLSEYAPNNLTTNFIRTGIESLASVPSIVLGLFGMALFVEYFHLGLTILGGALTLAMLSLPTLTKIIEEAMSEVPGELRSSALALGATKFQTLRLVIIPSALARIFTGISLVTGRAFGESAVILLVSGTSAAERLWSFDLFAPGSTLAVHLWYIQAEAIVPDASEIASKSAAVLVCVVFIINLILRIPSWVIKAKHKQI